MREKIEVPAALFRKLYDAAIDSKDEVYRLAAVEARPLVQMLQAPNLSIVGRQKWYRRTGNTYYTVTIGASSTDGIEEVTKLGPLNGYGDQYLYTALGWLKVNKPEWVEGWDETGAATIYLREAQIEYSMTEVTRERDL